MKKLNLICASIALVFGTTAAFAGTLATADVGGTVFATENFGGSTSAATDGITPGAVTYSMSNITAVNAGASVYFTVRLVGGKFAAAPATTRFSFAGQTAGTDITSVTLSTDKSTALVRVTSAGSVNIGLGAFSYTPSALNVDSVNSTLAAAGGAVTVSIGLTTIAPAAYEVTDALATVDAPVPTANLAVAAAAVTGAVAATAGNSTKIDLTASPAASAFTSARATLGSVTFTNVTGIQNKRAGAADYTLAAGNTGANTGVSVTVTPGAGQAFPVGSTLTLNSAETCLVGTDLGALSGSGTVAFTAPTALTPKVITTTAAVTTATPVFVCLTPPSANNVATPLTATLSAVVAPGSTTDLIASASGTGYALGYNGSSVDVLTYWPGALDAYNYKGYLRVTNTGTVTANVSLAHVSPTTGALSAATVIIANLMPGQSKLISTVAIDAVAGAGPSGLESGRVKVTAPTNGLRVQSLLQTGVDAPIEYRANNGL